MIIIITANNKNNNNDINIDMNDEIDDEIDDNDNEIDNDDDDDGMDFYTLKDKYEKMMEQNDGSLSEQFIKELYDKSNAKIAFHEIAKIVTQ